LKFDLIRKTDFSLPMKCSVAELTRRFLLLVLAGLFASSASCSPGAAPTENAGQKLVIESGGRTHEFNVELADTDDERRVGLMYRTEIPANGGMLFDFGPTPQPVSMWMKNTLIPLDMAFIANDGRIVRIAAETTPRSLTSIASGEPVVAVLEVDGGRLAALGVRPGDVVRHALFENQ
jgi:uncharacterized membrane protein (UPF0127 family)